MKKRNQSKTYKIHDIRFFLGTLLLMAYFMGMPVMMQASAEETKEALVYYEGNVTGRVNIRIGAGETNEKLVVNGKNVQLMPGSKVVILDEVMVKTKAWYYVRFDLDGKEQEGYCTSTYVQKTDIEITPTPLATPTPTVTPSPTPTPSPVPVTEAPEITQPPDKNEPKGSNNPFLPVIIIAGIAAMGGITFMIVRRISGNSEKNEMTKAVQGLQNLKISEESKAAKQGNTKKTPVIKPSRKEAVIKQESKEAGMESTQEAKEQLDEAEERLKKEAIRESEEKRALRQEIEELREHDLVEHKYFGKGEVFDNSDVNLIEVRFGNDVRFLNKDSLVKKKLLKKSDEVNRRWHI